MNTKTEVVDSTALVDFLIGVVPWVFLFGFVALIFLVIIAIKRLMKLQTERREELARVSAEITEIKEILKGR